MKNNYKFIIVTGLLLFLHGCFSSQMVGESVTICTGAPSTIGNVGETTVIIEGYDESIIRWTERTIFDRDEYESYFWGGYFPTDEDIRNWFEGPMNTAPDGIKWSINAITTDYIEAELIYDYTMISLETLNEIWQTENFAEEVTISSAVAGLVEDGAVCD